MGPEPLAEELLDSFADTLHQVNLEGVGKRWPQPHIAETMEADLLSANFFLERFKSCLEGLKERGLSEPEIARLFPYPSPIARIPLMMRGKHVLRMSRDELVGLFNTVARLAASHYREDRFCAKKRNILWSTEEQEKHLRGGEIADAETQDLLAQIDGKLWMYTEAIFTRWHNLGHEFHGPYAAGGESVVVKEWHDLKPDNWELHADFPYERIRCAEFYTGVQAGFDLHNRMISDVPLKRHITRFYIEVEGTKTTDKKELRKLSAALDALLDRAANALAGFDRELALVKSAEMAFYVLKPLADALGEDWRPSKECYDFVRKGKLSEREMDAVRKHNEGNHSTVQGERIMFGPWYDFPEQG